MKDQIVKILTSAGEVRPLPALPGPAAGPPARRVVPKRAAVAPQPPAPARAPAA
mgnify:CR=1 FL=1|jgi:hypothetical protein